MPIEKLKYKHLTHKLDQDIIDKINELIDKLHKLDTHKHDNIEGDISFPRYEDGSVVL